MKNPSRLRASILMIAFTFFSLSLVGGVQASSPINFKYAWTKTVGDGVAAYIVKNKTDSMGNIYSLGSYRKFSETTSNSVDFDPSTVGIDKHLYNGANDCSIGIECHSIFLTKYKSDGSYDWTRTITSSNTFDGKLSMLFLGAITIDSKDNIYVVGSVNYSGPYTVPGFAYDDSESSMYVIKYNSAGERIWIKKLGIANEMRVNGVEVDVNDNLYLTGSFLGKNFDFDSSSGKDIYSTNNNTWHPSFIDYSSSINYFDTFITKYNSDGTYGWTRVIPSGLDAGSYPNSLTTDDITGVYITGVFKGTVDFDVSPSVDTHTARGLGDIFVTKYNTSGKYLWTSTIGGSNPDVANAVISDGKTVTVLGNVKSDVEFSSSNIKSNITGNKGLLLVQYDVSGNYKWSQMIEGVRGKSITIDSQSNVFVGGLVQGNHIDMDPSNGVDTFSSTADPSSTTYANLFVSKYTPNGMYLWTFTYPGVNKGVDLRSLTMDKNDNMTLGGTFHGDNVDFDPSSGSDLLSMSTHNQVINPAYIVYQTNMFVTHLSQGGNIGKNGMDITNSKLNLKGSSKTNLNHKDSPKTNLKTQDLSGNAEYKMKSKAQEPIKDIGQKEPTKTNLETQHPANDNIPSITNDLFHYILVAAIIGIILFFLLIGIIVSVIVVKSRNKKKQNEVKL